MEARNAAAPEITDAQRAFIKASEEAESARIANPVRRRVRVRRDVRRLREACIRVGGCPREGGANDNSWGRKTDRSSMQPGRCPGLCEAGLFRNF